MRDKAPCRLLIDPPADGAWNMALDEALLTASLESQQPTLRFYQWSRPTLSLGYFQRYQDRAEHTASRDAHVVRRLSGGGAILHDREVTYSVLLPASHPLARDTQALYDALHAALIESLQGVIARENPTWQAVPCLSSSSISAGQEPFLCFERRFLGDILLRGDATSCPANEHKVVGSAQRRRRGVVLQHGSILLGRSPLAPELSGIREISGIELQVEHMLATLPAAIAEALRLDLYPEVLPTQFLGVAKQIMHDKYLSDSWTKRR